MCLCGTPARWASALCFVAKRENRVLAILLLLIVAASFLLCVLNEKDNDRWYLSWRSLCMQLLHLRKSHRCEMQIPLNAHAQGVFHCLKLIKAKVAKFRVIAIHP